MQHFYQKSGSTSLVGGKPQETVEAEIFVCRRTVVERTGCF